MLRTHSFDTGESLDRFHFHLFYLILRFFPRKRKFIISRKKILFGDLYRFKEKVGGINSQQFSLSGGEEIHVYQGQTSL